MTIVAIVLVVFTFIATRYWYKRKLDTAILIHKEEEHIVSTTFYHAGWRAAENHYKAYPDLIHDIKSHHEV